MLADGRVLIAKRIVPGADWIGRASADPGREGLLFTSGALDRLPPALDHAMLAAARDGDAWWLGDARRAARAPCVGGLVAFASLLTGARARFERCARPRRGR